MVGVAAAIGVMAAGRDLTLVVEQPVEHMRGSNSGLMTAAATDRPPPH